MGAAEIAAAYDIANGVLLYSKYYIMDLQTPKALSAIGSSASKAFF